MQVATLPSLDVKLIRDGGLAQINQLHLLSPYLQAQSIVEEELKQLHNINPSIR